MNVYLAEFIGTALLIYLGCGVIAGNSLKKSGANGAGNIVLNISWGIAVAMGMYAVGDISGAHFNPAISIAFATIGDFPWALVPGYIIAQILGAMFGATLVYLHYLPHWKETESAKTKLNVFATIPTIRNPFTNFLSEFLGTFTLVFVVLAIGVNEFTEGLNPIVVGMLIVVLGTALGGTTGCAINPARDFGPRFAHFLLPIHGKGDSDFKYGLIPIIAPILGGTLGALVHTALYDGVFDYKIWFVLIISLVTIIAFWIKGREYNKEYVYEPIQR